MVVDNEFATEAEAVVSESAPIALEATVRGWDIVLIVDEADALVAVAASSFTALSAPPSSSGTTLGIRLSAVVASTSTVSDSLSAAGIGTTR